MIVNLSGTYGYHTTLGSKYRWSFITRFLSTVVLCLLLVALPQVSAAKGPSSEGRGGSWIGWFMPDLTDFNDKLESNGLPTLDGTFTLYGGGGYGEWNNIRLGGFGGGGSLAKEEGAKRSELSMGFGGVHAARVWTLDKIKLEVGAVVGGGGATIVLSDGTPSSGDDAIVNPYDTVIDRGFFLVGPSLGARLNVTDLMAVHLSAGYLHTIGDWKHRNAKTTLSGFPDLNGSYISIGFVFGGVHP